MVVITVGGLPGSGTSTVCRLLKDRTGYDYVYAGQIFRDMAGERNMSLSEFGKLCEEDPDVDRDLDLRMLDLARQRSEVILEGRMTGPLCKREGIKALKIYLDARPSVRAERLKERDGGEIEEVIGIMMEREDSERKRYLNYYGIDPTSPEFYDLVIDSSDISPEEEMEIILRGLEGRS
jgi:predicted cytidylate kinase